MGDKHPSFLADAIESDPVFTAEVLGALRPIGVRLLVHAIVACKTAYGFADAGTMVELKIEYMALEST